MGVSGGCRYPRESRGHFCCHGIPAVHRDLAAHRSGALTGRHVRRAEQSRRRAISRVGATVFARPPPAVALHLVSPSFPDCTGRIFDLRRHLRMQSPATCIASSGHALPALRSGHPGDAIPPARRATSVAASTRPAMGLSVTVRERAATRHATVGTILDKLKRGRRVEYHAASGYSLAGTATKKCVAELIVGRWPMSRAISRHILRRPEMGYGLYDCDSARGDVEHAAAETWKRFDPLVASCGPRPYPARVMHSFRDARRLCGVASGLHHRTGCRSQPSSRLPNFLLSPARSRDCSDPRGSNA